MSLQTKITKIEQYFLALNPPPKSDALLVKVMRLELAICEKEARNLPEYSIDDKDRMTHVEYEEFYQKFPEWQKFKAEFTKQFNKANVWKD